MELLVVIAIIGVLIALLLPAVQAAREAARRTRCHNNFKQVGLGLQNYLSSLGSFPPAVLHSAAGCTGYLSGSRDTDWGAGTWSVLVLPYIEQAPTYEQFDFSIAYNVPPNSNPTVVNDPASGHTIEAYLCPSDPQEAELVSITGTISRVGRDPAEDVGRTNMAAVADSNEWYCVHSNGREWPRTDRTTTQPIRDPILGDRLTPNGVLYGHSGTRVAQITDGTSNTMLVGEVTGAFGLPGGEFAAKNWVVWTLTDTSRGINGQGSLPGGSTTWSFKLLPFSSYHPGGCHFAFCDGSAHFLNENIDQFTLEALASRNGGEAVEFP